MDPSTGRLKDTGYLRRDANLIFNRDAVKTVAGQNPVRALTKMRFTTYIITFAPK